MILLIICLIFCVSGIVISGLYFDKNSKKCVVGILLIILSSLFAKGCVSWFNHLETTRQTPISTESVAYELVPFKVMFDEHDFELADTDTPNYFSYSDDERYYIFHYKDLSAADEDFKTKVFLSDDIEITYKDDITPVFVRTTTVYAYSLNTFERILWYGDERLSNTTIITYELRLPESAAPSS